MEIIVVNDGSKDNSQSIVEEIVETKIQILRLKLINKEMVVFQQQESYRFIFGKRRIYRFIGFR